MNKEERGLLEFYRFNSNFDEDLANAIDKALEENEELKRKYLEAVDNVYQEEYKINKAMEYIENHYEDRSFDEIHDEMLEILRGKDE